MFMNINKLLISSGVLFASDMRLGPSMDGLKLPLQNGEYSAFLSSDLVLKVVKSNMVSVENLKLEYHGSMSTTMSLLGCFDLEAVEKEFDSFEDLYEWGFVQAEEHTQEPIFNIQTPSGQQIVCAYNESNEDINVHKLFNNGVLAGYEFSFTEVNLTDSKDVGLDYKFELVFENHNLTLYISDSYDEESVQETLIDEIRDLIEADDLIRIQQMITVTEETIDLNTPLSEFDDRLNDLLRIKCIAYEFTDEYEKDVSVEVIELDESLKNSFTTSDFVERVMNFFKK